MKKLSSVLSILALVAVTGSSALSPSGAQDAYDIEGKYKRIKPPRLLEDSDKVEVVDVFWYGCPHCYTLLPHMQAWEETMPEYVALRRLPAIFRESWAAHARAYYTARLLGVDDELHVPIFDAIHVEKQPLDTKEALKEFFSEHDVDEETFSSTYDSFTVDSLARQSEVMTRRWGVHGTPSLIVNGRYLISGSTAGSNEDMIKVLQALVEREHQAMAERQQE